MNAIGPNLSPWINTIVPVATTSFTFKLFSAFLLVAFAYHFLILQPHTGAPPLVKSWIPFIGTAIPFLANPEKFILQCKARYGDIFTLYMGGMRLHVVSDAAQGIPTVYKDHKTYSMSTVEQAFSGRVLGMSQREVNDTEFGVVTRATFVPLLLAQEKVDGLMAMYNKALHVCLEREIKRIDKEGDLNGKGVVVDMIALVRRIMGEASGKALFGETWPEDDEFFKDYETFDNGIYPLLKKYPSIFTRKTIEARERCHHRIVKLFQQPLVNCSELIEERVKVCGR